LTLLSPLETTGMREYERTEHVVATARADHGQSQER
jgi:hypothetical protein